MRVVIVGSSMAGSAMALALSKFCEVSVYDEKKENEIHEKVCGNVCTYSLENFVKELGIKEDFVTSRYHRINIFSKRNWASFPTKEYEISRKKLISEMMNSARKNGVKFNFSTRFQNIQKIRGHYEIFFEKHGKTFSDKADVVIGADGAASGVAKSIGKENKDFFLFLQTRVRKGHISRKDLIPEKNSYNVFVGKSFGYYSYIFPSKDGKEYKVGLGGDLDSNVNGQFKGFLDLLGIRKYKLTGAVVPKPKINDGSGNVFLIGDSSCNVKYSAGGIVPILEQVIALRDKILYNKNRGLINLRRKILFNRRMTRIIEKMNDADFDEVLGILRDSRYRNAFSSRDSLRKSDILSLSSPRLLLLAARISLRN